MAITETAVDTNVLSCVLICCFLPDAEDFCVKGLHRRSQISYSTVEHPN